MIDMVAAVAEHKRSSVVTYIATVLVILIFVRGPFRRLWPARIGTRTRGLYCILSREIRLASCAFARAGCCSPLLSLVYVLAPLILFFLKRSLSQLFRFEICVLLLGEFADVVALYRCPKMTNRDACGNLTLGQNSEGFLPPTGWSWTRPGLYPEAAPLTPAPRKVRTGRPAGPGLPDGDATGDDD